MADKKRDPKGEPERDYDVGRGKTPVHTRFPHQKVNRTGKKKGTKNWSTLAEEELSEQIELEGAGRPVKLDKRRVIMKVLVNMAAKGNLKAIELLMRLVPDRGSEDTTEFEGWTVAMLANFARRFGGDGSEGGGEGVHA